MNNIYKNISKIKEARKLLKLKFSDNCDFEDEISKYEDEHKESILHMIRCSENARYFARYLAYDESRIELISTCALLHDVGKLDIDPKVLYKVGKLTDEEWAIIKNHPNVKGIEKIGLSEEIVDSILYHHHRVSDYSKININSVVKIISLLDSFDAMSYIRCYKHNIMTLDEVVEEIKKNMGTQFDVYYGGQFIKYLESTYFATSRFYGKNIFN